jgi:hypothetical protein
VWTETNEKGKKRVIENPCPPLKRAQGRIATLLALIEPPDFLMCPVKGRSYLRNAREHVGAREIVTEDVSAYFPSTTWNRVYWFFHKRMNCSTDVAWTLASLATLEGHLPTGSPLSPILAYYAHQDMWLNVQRIARDACVKLTVYMDDLTLSGDAVSPRVVWDIKQQIHKTGLRLNHKKARRYGRGEAVVTGVVVTPGGIRLTKGANLKLKTARDERAAATDAAAAEALTRRLRGLEGQRTQVRKANAIT